MSAYADYLKSQGASPEEIAILDTPVAQRAFTQLQSASAAAETARAAAEARADKYKTDADEWYNNQIVPEYTRMQQQTIKAEAEAAKSRAVILAAQDQGLLKVAADMGFKKEELANPASSTAPFDASKYVTMDELVKIAKTEGRGIAAMAKISAEHQRLFPNSDPPDWVALYDEANGRNFQQHWESKFNVPAAREARAKTEKETYDAKLIKQGEEKARAELASQYGNPNTVPLSPSANPFVQRPSTGRDKQPWEAGDRSSERVQHATAAVMTALSGGAPKPN